MKNFEYKVLDIPARGIWLGGKIDYLEPTNKLKDLGHQGWEVITMGETNMWRGASRGVIVILKKEIDRP